MRAFCLLLCKMFLLFQGSDLMYHFFFPHVDRLFSSTLPVQEVAKLIFDMPFLPFGGTASTKLKPLFGRNPDFRYRENYLSRDNT